MRRKYLQDYVPSKPFCVYVITCLLNGKKYVGKAADAWKRWNQHREDAWTRQKKTALYNAMRKHKVTNFRVDLLSEHDTEQEAFDAECEAIRVLGTRSPAGYNLTDGGEGCSGHVPTLEHRRVMSQKISALWASGEQARNVRRGRERARWENGLCADFQRAKHPVGADGLCACRQPRDPMRQAFTRRDRILLARCLVALLGARQVRREVREADGRRRRASAAWQRQSAPLLARDKEMKALRESGLTLREIGARFGVHRSRVAKALERAA